MEVIKLALSDPGSPEYGVATRAGGRMRAIAARLEGVSADAAAAVADMARQVADILIMMRLEEVRLCT
eukprot:323201-Chlamydomonas_euryale.AAC.1